MKLTLASLLEDLPNNTASSVQLRYHWLYRQKSSPQPELPESGVRVFPQRAVDASTHLRPWLLLLKIHGRWQADNSCTDYIDGHFGQKFRTVNWMEVELQTRYAGP